MDLTHFNPIFGWFWGGPYDTLAPPFWFLGGAMAPWPPPLATPLYMQTTGVDITLERRKRAEGAKCFV